MTAHGVRRPAGARTASAVPSRGRAHARRARARRGRPHGARLRASDSPGSARASWTTRSSPTTSSPASASADILSQVRDTSITPPFHYLLAHVAVQIGDPDHLGARALARCWARRRCRSSTCSGSRTVGRGAALLGSALLALSPMAVWYGDEARAYATLTFLVVLSTYALLRALDAGRRRGPGGSCSCSPRPASSTRTTPASSCSARRPPGPPGRASPEATAAPARRAGGRHGPDRARLPALDPRLPGPARQQGGDPRHQLPSPAELAHRLGERREAARGAAVRAVGRPARRPGPRAARDRAGGARRGRVVARGRSGRPAPAAARGPRARCSWRCSRVATPVALLLYGIFDTSLYAPRNLLASLPGMCLLLGAAVAADPPALQGASAADGSIAAVALASAAGAARRAPAARPSTRRASTSTATARPARRRAAPPGRAASCSGATRRCAASS